MKYRSDIDGLRALAIIPVVLYHIDVELFRGGFVGVDIFFVISGYLITLIIAEEIQQKTFTISGFYERRIRRIFPALFAVILFCSFFAARIMLPQAFKDFGQSIVAATLFAANFHFLQEADYFGAVAETKPLLHTWSLSVEEQFYLLFPLLLVFIFKRLNGHWKRILVPAAFISLVLYLWGVHFFPSETFYLIPTRAWELLLGSFLAFELFPQIRKQPLKDAASLLGLLLIIWAITQFPQFTPFTGGHVFFACIGAGLIIQAGKDGTSLTGRLLSYRPIVFIGLISYSLYLWHWPVIVFTKQLYSGKYGTPINAGMVGASFLLAILSWRYVERPFRKKGSLQQRKRLFVTAIAVMLVSILSGSLIHLSKGWPARFGDDLISFTFDLKEYAIQTCFLDEHQHHSEWKENSCFLQSNHASNTLLWGDSFAAHYIPGIKSNLDLIDSNILIYSASGCAPAFNYDPAYRKKCKSFSAQLDRVIAEHDINTVIMAAGWALALENGLSYKDLQATVNFIRKKGIRVVMIGQSPRFDRSVQDISNRSLIYGSPTSAAVISLDLAFINTRLKEIAGDGDFVNPSDVFCRKQECRFKGDEGFYFWDDGHLTLQGSRKAAEYILSHIKI